MANNIKLLRGKNNMTQTDLANALGVSVQSIVTAEKNVTTRIAKKCAEYFNVSVFYVMGTDVFKVQPENEDELCALLESLKRK